MGGGVRAVVVGLALSATATGFLLLDARRFLDLQVYRSGIQVLMAGGDPYDAPFATSADIALPYIYPPFAGLFMAPLGMVPWPVAVGGVLAASLLALAGAVHVIVRHLAPGLGRAAVCAVTAAVVPLSLLLEPVRGTLHFGQVNLWLMGLVALDCIARCPGWPRGVLVGVAASIKVTPAAFLLFFWMTGDRRAARTALLTMLAAAAVGVVLAPEASLHYWTGEIISASGQSASTFATNQTIIAAVARVGWPVPVRAVLWAVLVGAVLAATVVIARAGGRLTALIATAAAALVISPISWTHHWVWVVPALLGGAVALARSTAPAVRVAGSWALPAAVAVFAVAPPGLLPSGAGRELGWAAWQHVVGNAYLLLALAGLALGAGGTLLRARRARRAASTGPRP